MRFIELFAGIRGFRYGLEKSNRQQQENPEASGCGNSISNQGKQPSQSQKWGNYTCVWANELDKYACQISRKHYPKETLIEGDIRTVDPSTIPEHDLLCAGFPCQSFSIAGKRRGFEDTRGTLFFEICRVIQAKRPGYVFLENVKGLLSHDDGATFQTIIGTLDELGYDCQWQVLNSKDYGVPQNRERVFIIGHTRGQPRPKVFPIGELHREDDEIAESEETTSVRCLGDTARNQSNLTIIRSLQGGAHSGGHHSGMTVIQAGIRSKGKPRFYENEVPAMAQAYGTGGGNVPMVAQVLQTDGQLRDGVSWGTDKPQSARNIRRLTPLECERLQGFPNGWTEGISDTQRYKCLGNAVTVNVIEAIGRQLLL